MGRFDKKWIGFVLLVFGLIVTFAWAGDSDLDGIDDAIDQCCATPSGIPVDQAGRPIGDLDLDCDVDLTDASMFWESYTGPLSPAQSPCDGDNEDECFLGTHNCGANATCTDTPGGFICTCILGYSGNGIVCQDINECLSHPCGQSGACTNLPGSYQCACLPGFVDMGGMCLDIDECQDEGICGDAGICVNEPGRYSCDCLSGHANCDLDPDCEVHLLTPSNSCASALFVGQTCGDLESSFVCTPTGFEGFSGTSGRGSMWIRARIDECSGCCSDLQHRYTLSVPLSTDYDLYVYSACGGALLASSSNGTDENEVVTPTLHDDCGAKDNSADVFIEIRHFSGSSCGFWQLTLEGREQ